jgi:hypothetical protein
MCSPPVIVIRTLFLPVRDPLISSTVILLHDEIQEEITNDKKR